MADPLFSSLDLGSLVLPHRVAMAPVTRNRAGDGRLTAEYDRQRASAEVIVTEAVHELEAGG